MYYLDYHLHSMHSFDGKSTLSDICESAVNKGMREICFAEHFSVTPLTQTYGYIDFNDYFTEIEHCKNKYLGKLIIKTGLEVCEPHVNKDKLDNALKDKNLDFVIGSVHNINEMKLRNYIKNKTNYEAYKGYFEEVYKAASFGDMDVLGHMDLLKRYAYKDLGNYEFNKFEDLLTEILKKLIERNIGIEINTSGVRSDVNEVFPSLNILKLYKSLGGEIITLGSDSHNTEFVGAGFNLGLEMLKECGFKYFFTFSERKALGIKI